jgi:hypothetical protein
VVADRQDAISIKLSSVQVRAVLRQAEENHIVGALGGLEDDQELVRAHLDSRGDPQLSGSLLIGLAVLVVLPSDGSDMRVLDVASALGASSSTAHRYLKTWVVVGLLERDPVMRRYRRVIAQ